MVFGQCLHSSGSCCSPGPSHPAFTHRANKGNARKCRITQHRGCTAHFRATWCHSSTQAGAQALPPALPRQPGAGPPLKHSCSKQRTPRTPVWSWLTVTGHCWGTALLHPQQQSGCQGRVRAGQDHKGTDWSHTSSGHTSNHN